MVAGIDSLWFRRLDPETRPRVVGYARLGEADVDVEVHG